ncbi:restriction endonuclease subunit S [Chromatium okenii]|uniref:Restriction endonuclease subunit S n=1 Tax=Chromatium okenii TaxID=61644 RepID=A0A2S7XTE3_9GAMM|nr:restriction endonuclease subunit S [Chromatium okenii]MBV5311157.1 restriction endonuclease subunit S [Chromatium okenii]PQJ96803.1 restriction endonuclease subunit S [Chromatium okenii]
MTIPHGYKLTDVGVIPEDWDVKCLGEVGEALIGLTYKPTEVREHGTLVLRSSNIQDDALAFDNNVFVEADIPERIMVRPDDVLICVRNGSRDLIGKSALLDKRTNGMTFGAFMAVYRSPIGKFVSYLFQSVILKHQINEHLGATINQITNKSLNSFRVPVPPITEQIAIATVLSDIDALITKLDQLIAKNRLIKQGAMQELLTGKTRLPGFSGVWEVRKFEDVAEIDPENLSANTDSQYSFQYIALEDIDRGKLMSYSEKTFSSAPSRAKRRIRIGDILVSTVRPNLQSHLLFSELGSDWVCSTGFSVVRCKSEFAIPAYLYAHLFAAKINHQIYTLITGSNYPAINSKDVQALTVDFPPIAEQTAIAKILSDMDAEITALEARCNKTRALKQGMMQELLTGKTRLA